MLGAGFLEKVYENALLHELQLRGLKVDPQKPIGVTYKGKGVGDYVPDLLVDDHLVVELKCVDSLLPEHLAQCLNYLKATGLHLALLFNFQRPKVEVKRVVLGF